MKRLLLALLLLATAVTKAQNVYITGGYAINRPNIKDGYEPNGLTGEMNGATQISKVSENGFFAGLGLVLKAKPKSTFGLRVEATYERYKVDVERTFTTQQTMFQPQTTFPANLSLSNSYLRLSPSLTYYKLRYSGLNYQADLGFSQVMFLGGWREVSSYSAVHVSAGLGIRGVLVKAGSEIALSNMLKGEGRDFKGYAKRYFIGVNVYPFTLVQKKRTKIRDINPGMYERD